MLKEYRLVKNEDRIVYIYEINSNEKEMKFPISMATL